MSESSDYTSSLSSSSDGIHSASRNVIVSLTYGSIILVTIIGNLMVIIAFATDARINRKIANWYILNLSVTDFVVGLVSMSVNLAWILNPHYEWAFGEIPCKMWLFVDYVMVTVAAFNIILISLDRYWLLTKKLDYPKYQTKRMAMTLIIFSWAFTAMFYGVVTFAWIPITGFEEEIDYSYNCELEATYHFEFQLFLIALFFVVPLLVVAYLNFIVYRNIRERSKGFVQSKPIGERKKLGIAGQETYGQNQKSKVNEGFEKASALSMVSLCVQDHDSADSTAKDGNARVDKTRKEYNRHRKAAITLAVLVGVFIVCWLPFYVTVLLGTLCESCVPMLAWEITCGLLWCNSTINPFLYAAMNLKFRRNFIKLLGLTKFIKANNDRATSSKDERTTD